MYTRFNQLYNSVFDKNNQVRACGRDVCRELILLSNQIETSKEHGNAYTGMMDVASITALKEKISNNKES